MVLRFLNIAADQFTGGGSLAEAARANRPLRHLANTDLSEIGETFDLAFSHEVIYLIADLEDHARQVAQVLKPGGCYDAVTCCHADSPFWANWRPMIAEFSNISVPNHLVADIVRAFQSAGLEVLVSRFLASAFIPMEKPSAYFPTEVERLDTYTKWKLCFRCVKPAT